MKASEIIKQSCCGNLLSVEREQLIEEVERLENIEVEVASIMDQSSGVNGWHLNGDTAGWSEFDCLADLLSVGLNDG